MQEFTVLVPHLGDKPEPYNKGDIRLMNNEFYISELLRNGVIEVKPEKAKPDPEKPKQAKKQDKAP